MLRELNEIEMGMVSGGQDEVISTGTKIPQNSVSSEQLREMLQMGDPAAIELYGGNGFNADILGDLDGLSLEIGGVKIEVKDVTLPDEAPDPNDINTMPTNTNTNSSPGIGISVPTGEGSAGIAGNGNGIGINITIPF